MCFPFSHYDLKGSVTEVFQVYLQNLLENSINGINSGMVYWTQIVLKHFQFNDHFANSRKGLIGFFPRLPLPAKNSQATACMLSFGREIHLLGCIAESVKSQTWSWAKLLDLQWGVQWPQTSFYRNRACIYSVFHDLSWFHCLQGWSSVKRGATVQWNTRFWPIEPLLVLMKLPRHVSLYIRVLWTRRKNKTQKWTLQNF